MHTIQHPEAAAYHHHAAMLEAHDKTLNRHYHNGIEIEQKINGYKINGCYSFVTLQQAVDFIERRQALNSFKDAYRGFPSIFENCLVYSVPTGEHEEKAAEANALIGKLGLPLVATETTFKTRDSFTVQYMKP
jgi:hypothetical protein